jgi:hypothetical protein
MRPDDQLRFRARRILTDGRKHAPAALKWAARILGWRSPQEMLRMGFTDRELSAGADNRL